MHLAIDMASGPDRWKLTSLEPLPYEVGERMLLNYIGAGHKKFLVVSVLTENCAQLQWMRRKSKGWRRHERKRKCRS